MDAPAHNVLLISFSIINVSRIHKNFEFMFQHMMFCAFPSRELLFLAYHVFQSTWCFVVFSHEYLFLAYIATSCSCSCTASLCFVRRPFNFQHMHCFLVFRKMSFLIHVNFPSLAIIISWLLFLWSYITWIRLGLL